MSAIVEAEEIALASDLVLVELIKWYFCDTVVPLLSLSYEKFIADKSLKWILRFHNFVER